MSAERLHAYDVDTAVEAVADRPGETGRFAAVITDRWNVLEYRVAALPGWARVGPPAGRAWSPGCATVTDATRIRSACPRWSTRPPR